MKKVSVQTSTDIAFIKYWGKKDEVLRLPENGSVSMKLAGLETITTIEFDPKLVADDIEIEGQKDSKETKRVVKHLDRIRKLAGVETKAKVVSKNNFPKATGLSSSGSGFAALTFSACAALELNLSERELSILSRQGSGTACRCACGGFVEWKDGETSETSYSETIFPKEYWDLRDVVAVVDENKKRISSTKGHKTAQSSICFKERQTRIAGKIKQIKELIANKDFEKFGNLVEQECLEFHSVLLTSNPPLIMWHPGTVEVMLAVQKMRQEGIQAFFTINTGFNVHIITLPEFEKQVKERIEELPLVNKILTARVGEKPQYLEEHLF